MRPKSLALLLVALGCGLVASIGITEVIARRNAEPAGVAGNTKSIYVATTDIGLGDLLTAQVLKLEQWPNDKVPTGAISKIEDVEGRRARTKLYANEPIVENRLLSKGASAQGATALIPKGYRVVPVRVDAVTGGASLILPGDRVDVMVYFTRDANREIPETMTRTILQDIKVFAVDDVVDLEKDKDGGKSIAAKTVSLLVTPEQAAKVVLATQSGSVNLMMRSPEDDQQIPNAQAKPSELFGNSGKSNRPNEALLSQATANLGEKTQSFVDFLNTMKAKAAAGAGPIAARSKARPMWSVRILKPGEVEEVQFESDEANGATASMFGGWKATGQATSQTSSPSVAPPATEKPKINVPPAAEEPQPPKPAPTKEKKDKAAS